MLFWVGRSEKISAWAISRRPEACISSESNQIVDLFMLYPMEVVAGLGSGKKMEFLAEEGSNFDDSGGGTFDSL